MFVFMRTEEKTANVMVIVKAIDRDGIGCDAIRWDGRGGVLEN